MSALAVLLVSVALAGRSPHLDSAADRTAFRRWFAFLAESRYYARKPLREIKDASDLVRWASRHALLPHDPAWAKSVELPLLPAMPSVTVPASPGPLEPIFVSREIDAAEPGDLLRYRNTQLPAHLMIYIGRSQVIPSPGKWVIYLTGDSSCVHKLSLDALRSDPAPDWRPDASNPDFLGVFRLDILRDSD